MLPQLLLLVDAPEGLVQTVLMESNCCVNIVAVVGKDGTVAAAALFAFKGSKTTGICEVNIAVPLVVVYITAGFACMMS